MVKILAIIKRPDEKYGHVTWISDTLANLQRNVGGYIETVTFPDGLVVICNEEGKLRNLPENCKVNGVPFVGDIIAVGADDGEGFTDVPVTLQEWKKMIS